MPPNDEFGLIRAWTEGRQTEAFLSSSGVAVGIGDDAAVVSAVDGMEWLLAVDTMVEEVHFKTETMDDADIGYKALAANVSDIVAMGGVPKHALVSVSVPPAWDGGRMGRLFEGIYACAGEYGIAVVGGDTTSAPRHLVVSVTLVGCVEAGKAIRRSGARPGQFVFLTGPTGLSAGRLHGMLSQSAELPKRLIDAHRKPRPSVKAGRLLQGFATSLNDVSDGLASEAWEIAEASGARLVLKEADLPISGALAEYAGRCGVSTLDWIFYGGEDYVLIGTAYRDHETVLKERFREESLPFFNIGYVEEGAPGLELALADGRRKPLFKRGYNHFAKG